MWNISHKWKKLNYFECSFSSGAVLFQVLVEFGESRKVLSLEGENTTRSVIKEAFGIDKEIILQIYNKEWQEFIDLEPSAIIEDRAKLRVIAKVSSVVFSCSCSSLKSLYDFLSLIAWMKQLVPIRDSHVERAIIIWNIFKMNIYLWKYISCGTLLTLA